MKIKPAYWLGHATVNHVVVVARAWIRQLRGRVTLVSVIMTVIIKQRYGILLRYQTL